MTTAQVIVPKLVFPFRESYMADNDLALGRTIEYLSHTAYWKNMLIVVTEDDAQNGVDHIDAHRSLLMVISPWVERDEVSHVHYSFGSSLQILLEYFRVTLFKPNTMQLPTIWLTFSLMHPTTDHIMRSR